MDILLVEDNAGDIMLLRLALAEVSANVNLHIARNDEQALAMTASSDFQPSLIILDLNIPRVPGTTLLERWQCNTVPVVVFSSSPDEAERARVLALGAREFVHKPSDLGEFIGAVGGIIERWGEGSAETHLATPTKLLIDSPTEPRSAHHRAHSG